MKNYLLGLLTGILIFIPLLFVQKFSYEKQKLDLIAVLSAENHQDKQQIRKQWREIVWLRGKK